MKIVLFVYLDQIANLLCVAAVHDPDLKDRNLNKPEISSLVARIAREHGISQDGWNDEVDAYEAEEIESWAYAQARRYTW